MRKVVALVCVAGWTFACGGTGAVAQDPSPAPPIAAPAPLPTHPAPPARPAVASAAAPEEPVEPAPAASGEWAGTIRTASGTRLVLSRTSGETPPVGAAGQLQKEVRQKLFGADVTAWLGVARVKVVKSGADSVTVDVLERESVVVVDGKEVDHLVPKSVVKLLWSE